MEDTKFNIELDVIPESKSANPKTLKNYMKKVQIMHNKTRKNNLIDTKNNLMERIEGIKKNIEFNTNSLPSLNLNESKIEQFKDYIENEKKQLSVVESELYNLENTLSVVESELYNLENTKGGKKYKKRHSKRKRKTKRRRTRRY
jgi:septal ring factor EnvC (AmiA/AmiB activator)